MATMNVTVRYTKDFQIQLDDSLTPEQRQREGFNKAFSVMDEFLESYILCADDFIYTLEEN